jgi:hypothetical protein
MKNKYLLEKLAQKIQLKIETEQVHTYLRMFDHLDQLLEEFEKVNIARDAEKMERIDVGVLTLAELEELNNQPVTTKRINSKNFT